MPKSEDREIAKEILHGAAKIVEACGLTAINALHSFVRDDVKLRGIVINAVWREIGTEQISDWNKTRNNAEVANMLRSAADNHV